MEIWTNLMIAVIAFVGAVGAGAIGALIPTRAQAKENELERRQRVGETYLAVEIQSIQNLILTMTTSLDEALHASLLPMELLQAKNFEDLRATFMLPVTNLLKAAAL